MVLTTVLINDNLSTTTEDLRYSYGWLIRLLADYSINLAQMNEFR